MTTWTAEELQSLERAGEIRVAGRRQDGSLRTLTIIWHVVVDGSLYVRSVRGAEGSWYKGVLRHQEGAIAWNGTTREVVFVPDTTVDDTIDAAYFDKYGNGSPSRAITNATARATTLRVEPK